MRIKFDPPPREKRRKKKSKKKGKEEPQQRRSDQRDRWASHTLWLASIITHATSN
jgi:hypothetical protein